MIYFNTPKIFKDMRFVTYSSEVLKAFISDFKALVSSLDQLDDGVVLNAKILDSKFLFSMLFLLDVNCFMVRASKTIQHRIIYHGIIRRA